MLNGGLITHSREVDLLDYVSDGSAFVTLSAPEPSDRLVIPAGVLPSLIRFTCCHRYEPFWNTAKAGTSLSEVPPETQYLLAEIMPARYLLAIPLIDGPMRCSLQGNEKGELEIVAESGDPQITASEVCGLYLVVGEEPFSLIGDSAEEVCAFLKSGRLRAQKPVPPFVEGFGWCTWDAFYTEVSESKIGEGLSALRDGGVRPKFLIVDDGWLQTEEQEDKSQQLTSFKADPVKFPNDLKGVVDLAKGEFGVQSVIAWHAVAGYWGGTSPKLGYESKSVRRELSTGILHHTKEMPWWGENVAVVPIEQVHRFYQDFHRYLRLQGIDGVKIDTQAALETFSKGMGGRVKLMQRYHEAMEGSSQVHFEGALINCMSNANEMIYSTLASTLMRTSTDFWPNRPESHGQHLYVNAQVGVWFGEFIHPDWDMFQSGHPAGAFHAAGRAVSGSPVYVSDKPGAHDFEVLKKLVLPNGEVLRCLLPGRPTLDCLFIDPTKEEKILKVWNENPMGAVIGAFNAYFSEEGGTSLSGAICPCDIPTSLAGTYALFTHTNRSLLTLDLEDSLEFSLDSLGWEVFTLVLIEDGFAPIGLENMLNSNGAVLGLAMNDDGAQIWVRGSGAFLAFCEWQPVAVFIDGDPAEFTWDLETSSLRFELPEGGTSVLVMG